MNCNDHPGRLWPALPGLGALLLLLALAACHPRPSQSPDSAMRLYTYLDGMGNAYLMRPDSLVYDPIRAEESSSGMVDGGAPAACALSAATYDSLRVLFEAAIAARDQHIAQRVKGSGVISIQDGSKEQSCLLGMTAPAKAALESALKTALHRP